MDNIEQKVLSYEIRPNEQLTLPLNRDYNSAYSIEGVLPGKLEWGDLENIILTPDKNYTGSINIGIQYRYEDRDRLVNLYINVANIFKPRARIIKIIGQELISNDVIALVELIKNSYDADAEHIDIHLNEIFSDQGEIIIKDDGTGMTYEKIVNVWLEPATPDKKAKTTQTFSACFKRRFLGEKGIGRFAVHRLGENIELITRAKINCSQLLDYETKIIIDWSDFSEDKYLSEIPVTVTRINNPVTFTNTSGTIIRITKIQPWKNIKSVKDAATKIKGLESPIKPRSIQLHELNDNTDPGLTVEIKSANTEIEKALWEIKSLNDLLDTAFYKFNGIIDEKGNLIYDYIFNRPDYQDIKRSPTLLEEFLPANNPEWFDERPLNEMNNPGQFEISFYAWDLETATLRIAGLADYYRNVIKPNAGIRIYRDNFRVWPYGEPGDDWLGLDLKRLNTPKERSVSRNQVFGVVHISSIINPQLKDQSNREGLINNEQYENFYQLVNSALTVFAKERKSDKVKMDKVSRTKSMTDLVTESIDKLRINLEKRQDLAYYENDINQIENAYKERINDVLERYMMAAAIGISYSVPIHEMKLRLTSIKNVIDDLNENPNLQDKFLKQLSSYVQETEDIIMAVTSMMSRQKRQKVNLYKVARNVHVLKESDLKKYNVSFEIKGDKEIQVEAVPGLLNTAVLNLVDNAIYWLRSAKLRSRNELREFNPTVTITILKGEDGRGVMQIKDNGYGFEDPFELLIEPYYSRKTDGLGLGLFLVNEIMTRLGGRLNGYNKNGAVFELTFQTTNSM
ncbi:ATP-binding protein [Chitinophaga pinensis]|uniref:histidine kinase n=1 Tax=Chitinophaga pinensis (strain ATCC 43595 / DSM 2588 / LMG 13176 / NBRC 15968 / NCIMB 11800 / UQM 2034) TaxID=485918 RepID=A0A979GQH5_CHIPD|nr:ATP-binding protein [Chitinophaga pinensis]ACU60048.1 histidine kinase [Chitinophaga pinensis DSM 2588]